MFTYRMGGKDAPHRTLTVSPDKLVVRHAGRDDVGSRRPPFVRPEALEGFIELEAYAAPEAGVEVYAAPVPLAATAADERKARRRSRDRARAQLRASPAVRFAGRALEDARTGGVVLYTENLFVRFADGTREADARAILAAIGVRVKRGPAAFGVSAFVGSADGRGTGVFAIAAALLERADVVAAHPELIFPRRAPGAAVGWRLGPTDAGEPDSGVAAAWETTRGHGATIAVIDDGVDVDHPAEPRAFGVAPEARVLPIQLRAGLGSFLEADAILTAVEQGADVILCGWRRADGHGPVPLPDVTRLAMEVAATRGRDGLGCTIVWAAGNGNESLDDDGYVSHPDVIAVGAANASGQRASYGNFGTALWCLFPSGGARPPGIAPSTPGGDIVTATGGTSAAAAGVAGVCALMTAANARLRASDVRALLRRTAVPIEAETARYDASGHSVRHGYGLVRADAAIAAALADGAALGDAFSSGRQAEAIVVEVADPADRDGVAAAIAALLATTTSDGWSIVSVEDHPHLLDVLPPHDAPVPPIAAWDLAHDLTTIDGVAGAEPTFEPIDAPIVPAPEALPQFCELDPTTDAHRLGRRWHHDIVHSERAWSFSAHTPGAIPKGGGILVAHPDSGYRTHHGLQPDRIDPRERDFIDDDDVAIDDRDGGHGLATASVVLGEEPGSDGVIGTAPHARLLPLRVVRRTIFSFTVPILVEVGMRRLRDAIDYAVDHDAHVVSISLGGLGGESSARAAVKRAVDHGVIVLAAAGNVVSFVVNPAAFPEVIAVAACDVRRRPWRYTASGAAVDVTAPGAAVWSASIDRDQAHVARRSCGTSFAVAVVAGAAATWLAHHGRDALIERFGRAGLVAAFRGALTASAAAEPGLPPQRFGAGILDLNALLRFPLASIRPTARRPERTPAPVPALARLFPDLAPKAVADVARRLLGVDTTHEVVALEAELAFVFETDPRLAASLRRLAFASASPRDGSFDRASALFDLRVRLRSAGISRRLAERLAPPASTPSRS